MQRQGQIAEEGLPAPEQPEPSDGDHGLPPRRPATGAGGPPGRRASPRQFLHEVNVELRKVAWPTRAETTNYAIVVFVALAVLMAVIFALDIGFSNMANYLFK
jgi:preprotein translocase subunit SecE